MDACGETSEGDGGAEPRGDPDPHAPVQEERPVPIEDEEDVRRVKAARTTLEAGVQQEQTALHAALAAVQAVGGSEHSLGRRGGAEPRADAYPGRGMRSLQ